MMDTQKTTVHFVPHTHWDREWYLTFEAFRFHLLRLIDNVITLLESDTAYLSFMLDGQTILLEDYLTIRPENRERLRKLIQAKRLWIGPWYVLADEFLVSGEALIRNLLRGSKLAEEFGRRMNVGYVPDTFGHIAQLPQILNGFGLDSAVLWRGVDPESINNRSEARWIAPDSSEVFLLHLPKRGYCMFHTGCYPESDLDQELTRLISTLKSRTSTKHLLILHGADHLFPDAALPELIENRNRKSQDFALFSSLEEALACIRKAHGKDLPILQGELRSGFEDYAPLLQGVTSSRIPQKQKNWTIQTRIERIIEPSSAMAFWFQKPFYQPEIRRAWQLLLTNHPHDSICGCSVDSVHREIDTRFSQCESLLDNVQEALLGVLNSGVPGLTLINPSLNPSGGLSACRIQLPSTMDHFEIRDATGTGVPHQIISTSETKTLHRSDTDFPKIENEKTVQVLLQTGPRAPLSLTGFTVHDGKPTASSVGDVRVGLHFLENSHLRVDAHENGKLSVLVKKNGQRFDGLLGFEDGGDVGDEYNYSPPELDRILCSGKTPARISVFESGPLRGALRIRIRLQVPAEATRDRRSRSRKKGMIKVWTTVRLEADSTVLTCETEINNSAKDHRLRICFPTGCRTHKSRALTPFHMTRRISRAQVTPCSVEVQDGSAPTSGLVHVEDSDGRALSLFTKGLYEYELKADTKRTLALTLLRSVGVLSADDLLYRPMGNAGPPLETPEAQCPGSQRFEYALKFYNDLEPKPIESQIDAYESYILPAQISTRYAVCLSLPISIETDTLRITAFKPAEDGSGLILRLLNVSDHSTESRIRFLCPVTSINRCRLDETELTPLDIQDGCIQFSLTAWQLVTLHLIP